MKVILDIDDKVFQNMEGYCKTQNIELNQMLEGLFNKYVQGPASIIDILHGNTGSVQELSEFSKTLASYFNEAILDIGTSIDSEEEYEDDRTMVEVFKRIMIKHMNEPFLLTDLFKTYWNHKQNITLG